MKTVDDIVQCFRDSFEHPAEGDRCVMMAALYNRLQKPDLHQPRTERPRRTRVIQKYLFDAFEIPGLPKWGATAVRGDLMDNKEHIRRFIDHVNELPSDQLQEAWEACGALYKEKMEAERTPIELNPDQSYMSVIRELMETGSVGQIQQPLCYAAVLEFHTHLAPSYEVETKRVYAGDQQSGVLGDVQVLDQDGELTAAYEIKAHKVDKQKVQDVLEDHGRHDYVLTIVATGFDSEVKHRANLILVELEGFLQTVVSVLAGATDDTAESTALSILETYNHIMRVEEDRPGYAVDLS